MRPSDEAAQEAPQQQHDAMADADQWAQLPADLLYRIAAVVVAECPHADANNTVASMFASCRSWGRSLKIQLQQLSPCYLDVGGVAFSGVRRLHAPLRRGADADSFGFTWLAPLRRPDLLPVLLPSLTSIDVSQQQLGEQGLRPLQPLAARLQVLDVSGCAIASADLPILASLVELTELRLNGVRLLPGSGGFGEPAARGFPTPTAVLSLEVMAAVGGLKRLRCLEVALHESLHDMPGHKFPFAGPAGLPAAAGGGGVGGGAGTAGGRTWRRSIDGVYLSSSVDRLVGLPALSRLRAPNNPVTAGDVERLARCTALTELCLLWNEESPSLELGAAPWARLVGLTGLVVLDLLLPPAREGATGTQPLSGLRCLRSLTLRNVNSAHTLLSVQACTQLTELDLRRPGEHATPECVVQVRLGCCCRVCPHNTCFGTRVRAKLCGTGMALLHLVQGGSKKGGKGRGR